jgi:hypothetical protein
MPSADLHRFMLERQSQPAGIPHAGNLFGKDFLDFRHPIVAAATPHPPFPQV